MSASYSRYTKLNSENAEVRIMVLQPDSLSSHISCTLEVVPLPQANPFYALSYVWGDADNLQTITIDDEDIYTRKNLCDFLENLAATIPGPIRVWVDFLCINQYDVIERNSQVAMMGEIYSAADSVYAWLGPQTCKSDKVFDFVEQSRLLRSEGEPYWKIYNSNSDALDSLEDITSRTYWTRLWIIQEIVLAKRLWLFCGSRLISWDDLQFVLAGSKSHSSSLASGRSRLLHYLKESRESTNSIPLSRLVHKFISAECQDGRDKIYALLALAHEESKRRVKVDYGKHLLQVLVETFQDWASEWMLEQDNISNESDATASYTPSFFCQQLSALLSEDILLDLYDSSKDRIAITAKINLKGTWENGPLEFRAVATIGARGEWLQPVSDAKTKDRDYKTTERAVSHVIKPDGCSNFIYTTITPISGDRILNIGPIILIIRQKGPHPCIVGRGIQQTCTPTESVFHPCSWSAQLLPETTFEFTATTTSDINDLTTAVTPPPHLTRRRSSRKDDVVSVTLNASALVELLIATKEQEEEEYTWSPYEFGRQHDIVDLCRECRLARNFVNYKRRGSRAFRCSCVWAGAEQALSTQLRKVRRYCSGPV
ncbi:hypothetical protein LTR05_003920 [Lithohypha guttulata]|uniref:Heterokaryon incompatibility domain-containing protein n=1 Tax=Lithohypha guttulata TaxID=1690604 RepID=A0AAN7T0K5_9EURO|nr:hypothetical protein LTR05_003920 [Lithohypha guttulata]